MPISSYLAHPVDGRKADLQKALEGFSSVDVIPAENKDVLIIVTETRSKQEDEDLKNKIEELESLQLLAMVSGFDNPQSN